MNNCPYKLEKLCPGCKETSECKIIERHHIISKGHMSGKLTENWELNVIPMFKSCHANYSHIGHEKLWEAKQYCIKELRLLALLGSLPYYPKAYPLIGERARWAWQELEKRNDIYMGKTLSDIMIRMEISRLAWGISDIPVWIERAYAK